jgi:hypothetical protein
MRATMMAAAGRQVDLDAARRASHTVLGRRNSGADSAWASLETRTAHLHGTGATAAGDDHRPHAPTKMVRRAREPRFLRAS